MQRCQPSSVPLQQGRHVGFPYEPRKGFVEATMQVQDINIEPPYLPNEGQGEVPAESEQGNRESYGKNFNPKRLGLNNSWRKISVTSWPSSAIAEAMCLEK